MFNGSNLDHYYRIHTKSNDLNVERYLLENERLRTFDYTLGYPFPNPWCYWREGECNDQSDYPDDMAIRYYIPGSLFNYYYARKGSLIPAKDWARDSKDLVAVDKLIIRCTVETIPEDKGYLRPVEWDHGFWGQDGRIIMGETKDKSGEFKAIDGLPEVEYREMIVSSAPPSASCPILKLHPPKRAGSAAPGPRLVLIPPKAPGAGPRPGVGESRAGSGFLGTRLKRNPARKATGSRISANIGLKKKKKVRERPALR